VTLIAIISAGRPHQVALMEKELEGLNPVWYVPMSQAKTYLDAGAVEIRGIEGDLPMKSIQLNAALDEGFSKNETVVTLDDDYVWCKRVIIEDKERKVISVSLQEVIEELVASLQESHFHLAGVAATTNALWSSGKPKFRGSLTGQIMVQTPSPIRYDANLKSFVDNEYCMAHHAEYGGVILHTQLLVNFHMLGRSVTADKKYVGGLKDLRTKETHYKACEVMTERYGVYVEPVEPGQRRKMSIIWKDIYWKGKPSWNIK
jgi:hypothetical protein